MLVLLRVLMLVLVAVLVPEAELHSVIFAKQARLCLPANTRRSSGVVLLFLSIFFLFEFCIFSFSRMLRTQTACERRREDTVCFTSSRCAVNYCWLAPRCLSTRVGRKLRRRRRRRRQRRRRG